MKKQEHSHQVRDVLLQTRTGLVVRGVESGEPSHPPLLMLHGWLDNAASHAGLMPLLPGRRCVAVDLPGHGKSDHLPASAGRHFIDWVPLIEDIVDALGWERFELLGHSMGAGAASLYAGVRAERVSKLVLVEGMAPGTTPALEVPEQLRRGLRSRARALERSPRQLRDLDEAVSLMLSARMPMSREGALLIAQRNTHQSEQGLVFCYDPLLQMASLLRLDEAQLLAVLAQISAPTLMIRAHEGWPMEPRLVQAFVDAVGDVRVEEVEGGHHVHLDHPERVALLVCDFLGL